MPSGANLQSFRDTLAQKLAEKVTPDLADHGWTDQLDRVRIRVENSRGEPLIADVWLGRSISGEGAHTGILVHIASIFDLGTKKLASQQTAEDVGFVFERARQLVIQRLDAAGIMTRMYTKTGSDPSSGADAANNP